MTRRSIKRTIVWAAIQLAVTTCAAASAKEVHGRTYVLGQGADAVRVIEVWGSPYEMGYAHGYLIRGELKQYWSTFLAIIKGVMGVTDAQLDRAWQVMSRHIAGEFKEEMRGLAAGAGVPEQWVHWMHILSLIHI